MPITRGQMTEDELRSSANRETYNACNQVRPGREEAEADISAFLDAVGHLRAAYRIPELVIVAGARYAGDDSVLVSAGCMVLGDRLNCGPALAATAVRQAQGIAESIRQYQKRGPRARLLALVDGLPEPVRVEFNGLVATAETASAGALVASSARAAVRRARQVSDDPAVLRTLADILDAASALGDSP